MLAKTCLENLILACLRIKVLSNKEVARTGFNIYILSGHDENWVGPMILEEKYRRKS